MGVVSGYRVSFEKYPGASFMPFEIPGQPQGLQKVKQVGILGKTVMIIPLYPVVVNVV